MDRISHRKGHTPMNLELLRHCLATVAYRGNKALRDAPPGFSSVRPGPGSRSAGEILAHMGDLLDWGASIARGAQTWHNSTPQEWDADVARFFKGLTAFDEALGSDASAGSNEELFQGPIADLLTHIGQIGMLRRLAGSPVKGENYAVAAITTGRVGADQPAPRYEF
jgi:hypothetical protein